MDIPDVVRKSAVLPTHVRRAVHKVKLARIMAACHGVYFSGLALGNHELYVMMGFPLMFLCVLAVIFGEGE